MPGKGRYMIDLLIPVNIILILCTVSLGWALTDVGFWQMLECLVFENVSLSLSLCHSRKAKLKALESKYPHYSMNWSRPRES